MGTTPERRKHIERRSRLKRTQGADKKTADENRVTKQSTRRPTRTRASDLCARAEAGVTVPQMTGRTKTGGTNHEQAQTQWDNKNVL